MSVEGMGAANRALEMQTEAQQAQSTGHADQTNATREAAANTNSRTEGRVTMENFVETGFMNSALQYAQHKRAAREFENLLQFGQIRRDTINELANAVIPPAPAQTRPPQ